MRSETEIAITVAPWRIELFTRLIRTVLIVSPFAILPSIAASYREGLISIIVLDIVGYALLIPIYLGRERHYMHGAFGFCLITLAFGTLLVYHLGTDGASLLWILVPPLVAEILLPPRPARLLFVLTGASFALLSVAMLSGLLRWHYPIVIWVAVVTSYLTVVILLVAAVRFMLRGIANALRREHEANVTLQKAAAEKEVLLQEIHHRVKNNLQVISSLMSLQRNDGPDGEVADLIDLMAGRIAAMAHSYQHLITDGNTLRVDLPGVLRAIAVEHSRRTGRQVTVGPAEGHFDLDLETTTMLALGVNEIVGQYSRIGRVLLELSRTSEQIVISVSNEHPSNGAFAELSRDVLMALTSQLGGTANVPDNCSGPARIYLPAPL